MSAGKIRRYHTAPVIEIQTVADHTYGVCQILRYILEENVSSQLFKAALDHDVSEYWLGDMPHPTKKAFPQLYEIFKAVEDKVMMDNELTQPGLTNKEKICLLAADWLEAAVFGARQTYMGNNYGFTIMEAIFQAMKTLDSAVLPQRAKDLWIELEQLYVARQR